MTPCPHCLADFERRRADQVYCTPKCRLDHYKAALGDGNRSQAIVELARASAIRRDPAPPRDPSG